MNYSFKVDETLDGQRLDKALSTLCADLSRSRLQALIKDGQVSLNGINSVTASEKVERGDRLDIVMPPLVEAAPKAQDIALNIVYEDKDLLVINKPVGLVVHPGAGNHDGTLVNALLHHCGESLSGIGGVIRPGIVHRLDKDTTGLMVVAKNDFTHQGLSAQLADRSLSRVYYALVLGTLMPPMGMVNKPLGRDLKNRQKMAVTAKNSRDATTHYKSLHTYADTLSLVECHLESGRTHQIRVHMAHIKHPLIGDPLYGAQITAVRAALKRGGYEPEVIEKILSFDRQALHAKELSFIHPALEEEMSFESDLPDDFAELLELLG
jgi:23S rRNA pseudouridine1911/1915/1917 synthase